MGSAAGISQQGLQLSSNNSYDCALQDLNQDGWLDILLPAFGGSGEGLIYWSSEGSFSADDFATLPGYNFTLHAVSSDADGMAGSICCWVAINRALCGLVLGWDFPRTV